MTTRQEFQNIRWQLHHKNPLIQPPLMSTVIADPSFIFPEESPDKRWHLFAHSLHGMEHYISHDGIEWKYNTRILRGAMRPFLIYEKGFYYLFYEKIRKWQIYLSFFPVKWSSSIAFIKSKDLRTWSDPVVVLEPTLDWHKHEKYGDSVSNPCILKEDDGFRLYYSASLAFLEDCGFNEPLSIGTAFSKDIEGIYQTHSEPILTREDGGKWTNLGCGSIKVKPLENGYIALQNGIYTDDETGHTGSAVLELESTDGIKFSYTKKEPILKPTSGWMGSHVYAVDFKPDPSNGQWFLYFNARNTWHWSQGKEHIGLAIGAPANG